MTVGVGSVRSWAVSPLAKWQTAEQGNSALSTWGFTFLSSYAKHKESTCHFLLLTGTWGPNSTFRSLGHISSCVLASGASSLLRTWIRKTFRLNRWKGVNSAHQGSWGEKFKNYKCFENIKDPLALARKMSTSQKIRDSYWAAREGSAASHGAIMPSRHVSKATNDTNPF